MVEREAGHFQRPASAERSRKHTLKAKNLQFKVGEAPKATLRAHLTPALYLKLTLPGDQRKKEG